MKLNALSFSLYTRLLAPPYSRSIRSIKWKQLIRIPFLFARAEDSGSEGCYVEIAKWNRHSRRYERFAHAKFFGGELWQESSAETTAARVATMINLASCSDIPFIKTRRRRTYKSKYGDLKVNAGPSVLETMPYEFASIIHHMPTWNPLKT